MDRPTPHVTLAGEDHVASEPQAGNANFFQQKLDIALTKLKQKVGVKPSSKDDPSVVEAASAVSKPQVIKLVASVNEAMKELTRITPLPDEILDQLYEKIVDRNGMLSAYLVLNGVKSAYWSTCCRFTRQAQELRQALSKLKTTDPTARECINTINKGKLNPTARACQGVAFATDYVKAKTNAYPNHSSWENKVKANCAAANVAGHNQNIEQAVLAASPHTQWWKNGLTFPWLVTSREHELSTCAGFSLLITQQRCNGTWLEGWELFWSCCQLQICIMYADMIKIKQVPRN